MNRLPAIMGGDEPSLGVAGQIEQAWAEFWQERCPEELKGQCDADNREVLKRVFVTGFAYGARWQKGQS